MSHRPIATSPITWIGTPSSTVFVPGRDLVLAAVVADRGDAPLVQPRQAARRPSRLRAAPAPFHERGLAVHRFALGDARVEEGDVAFLGADAELLLGGLEIFRSDAVARLEPLDATHTRDVVQQPARRASPREGR